MRTENSRDGPTTAAAQGREVARKSILPGLERVGRAVLSAAEVPLSNERVDMRLLRRLCLTIVGSALAAGCADNAMVLKSQVDRFQQQQVAMTRQYQELQARAAALDRDNQELAAALAQTRQQSKIIEDQLAGTRDQLRSVTAQLAQAKAERVAAEKQIETVNASMKRQSGTTITPNSSLPQALPNLNLPPGCVRRDGDVIRVALPARELFEPGTAQLKPTAAGLIVAAGSELLRLYPEQMIGVEGYTDSEPMLAGRWRSAHELSMAYAMTVYDLLISRTQLRPNQLFVCGHGGNHPMASNATPEGREMNRRVELVVYPEKRQ